MNSPPVSDLSLHNVSRFTGHDNLTDWSSRRGDEVIILLVGGNKSSQQNDIALAQDLMRNLQE